jgi:hypothetical protein
MYENTLLGKAYFTRVIVDMAAMAERERDYLAQLDSPHWRWRPRHQSFDRI